MAAQGDGTRALRRAFETALSHFDSWHLSDEPQAVITRQTYAYLYDRLGELRSAWENCSPPLWDLAAAAAKSPQNKIAIYAVCLPLSSTEYPAAYDDLLNAVGFPPHESHGSKTRKRPHPDRLRIKRYALWFFKTVNVQFAEVCKRMTILRDYVFSQESASIVRFPAPALPGVTYADRDQVMNWRSPANGSEASSTTTTREGEGLTTDGSRPQDSAPAGPTQSTHLNMNNDGVVTGIRGDPQATPLIATFNAAYRAFQARERDAHSPDLLRALASAWQACVDRLCHVLAGRQSRTHDTAANRSILFQLGYSAAAYEVALRAAWRKPAASRTTDESLQRDATIPAEANLRRTQNLCDRQLARWFYSVASPDLSGALQEAGMNEEDFLSGNETWSGLLPHPSILPPDSFPATNTTYSSGTRLSQPSLTSFSGTSAIISPRPGRFVEL